MDDMVWKNLTSAFRASGERIISTTYMEVGGRKRTAVIQSLSKLMKHWYFRDLPPFCELIDRLEKEAWHLQNRHAGQA